MIEGAPLTRSEINSVTLGDQDTNPPHESDVTIPPDVAGPGDVTGSRDVAGSMRTDDDETTTDMSDRDADNYKVLVSRFLSLFCFQAQGLTSQTPVTAGQLL